GYWVNNDVDTLTEAVSKILNSDHTTLQEMGKRGRQLVLDKYAVGRVSEQMVQLYDWVTGKIDKPDFIYY
ncbi:glycosyltransferase, partial [Parabacteroides goldsteinii]